MSSEDALADQEGLWGLVLGKKYDRLSEANKNLENLVSEFYRGRKSVIDENFTGKDGLIGFLQDSTLGEGKETIRWIWGEDKYRHQSRGMKYRVESSISDELQRAADEKDAIIQRYQNGLTLIWPRKSVRHTVVEGDDIESRLEEEAKPIFARNVDDSTLELRGAKSRLRQFNRSLVDSPNVSELDFEPVQLSIVEGLSSIFDGEIETLTLTEAEFERSYLPSKSAITISNKGGIQGDLDSEKLRPDVIDQQSLTDITRLKFNHKKTDKTFSLKSHNSEQGIYFTVRDNNIPDGDKKNITEILAEQFGLYLDSVYEYDAQLHDDYILNQIFSGNYSAYERHFEDLDEEKRAFISEYTKIDEVEILECYRCHEEYELEVGECECGNDTFRSRVEKYVIVDDDSIFEAVEKRLSNLDDDIIQEDFKILDLSVEREEREYNNYLKATFKLAESAGVAMDYYYSDFYIYCIGNRQRLPRKIGDYLHNTVLISYGNSYFDERDNFGIIDLYDLLNEESPEDQFSEAIAESQSLLMERVRDRVHDAEERIRTLNRASKSIQSNSDGLEGYEPDNLERDVFYVLKFMFRYTERLGRPAKKEPDGCLLIPLNNGDHYVAGYDTKLSFAEGGYDIDSSEKKKAGWYISVLNENDLIRNLKDGGSIDSHIFISNNLNENQFRYVGEAVREWQERNENADGESTVVFMETGPLLRLYEVMVRNFDYIYENSTVHDAFRLAIVDELSGDGPYCVFDEASVERIREAVLEKRSEIKKKRDAF